MLFPLLNVDKKQTQLLILAFKYKVRFEPNANVVFAFEARQPSGAVGGSELPHLNG